eukprot:527721-Pleurochrysis_carterae.AAC.4
MLIRRVLPARITAGPRSQRSLGAAECPDCILEFSSYAKRDTLGATKAEQFISEDAALFADAWARLLNSAE